MSGLSFSTLPRRRVALILVGLTLNALTFSASFTFLNGFQQLTASYIGEPGVVTIYNPSKNTVFTGSVPLYMATELEDVPGVISVSPEVISAASTLDGLSVTLRGATGGFFEIQRLEAVRGELKKPGPGECLVGYRAFERLLEAGEERITLIGVLREALLEAKVIGVYRSGTPMDDEVILPLDAARAFNNLGPQRVTLIRVVMDERVLTEEKLRETLTHTYRLRVNALNLADAPWETDLEVRGEGGALVEKRALNVPGEAELELQYGRYTVTVHSAVEEIVLDSDTELVFTLSPDVYRLLLVVEDPQGLPLPYAEAQIINIGTGDENSYRTNLEGEAEAYLVLGEYRVTVSQGAYAVTRLVKLVGNAVETISLGPRLLRVNVVNGASYTGLEGVKVTVGGQGETHQMATDAEGYASFRLQEGRYNVTVHWGEEVQTRELNLVSDANLVLYMGLQKDTHRLQVVVTWHEGTPARGAQINIRGGGLVWSGFTDSVGRVEVELPPGDYDVSAVSQEIRMRASISLDKDLVLRIKLPAPTQFDPDSLSPEWIKYLPQDLAVSLSEAVFEDSMRSVINLVTLTLVTLASIFTLATTVNSIDLIGSSIAAASHSMGVLRAVGATREQTLRILAARLLPLSLAAGVIGYGAGYVATLLVTQMRLLTVAGYVLELSPSLTLLAASAGLSLATTSLALWWSGGALLRRSIFVLLGGLTRSEVLHIKIGAAPLASFLTAFLVRLIPEVIMWPLPIGYDTLSVYIPAVVAMRSGFERSIYEVIYQRPFFWVLGLLPLPFEESVPFKVLPPLLHGLLGLSVYLYGREVFGDQWKALAASLLSTIYFVGLRVSWDLHANELGLVLVFLSLTLIRRGLKGAQDYLAAFGLIFAATLTHEGASMVLFLVAAYESVRAARREGGWAWARYMVLLLPPFIFFIYRLVVLDFPLIADAMGSSRYPSETYGELVSFVVIFYVYLVLPLLPFSALGVTSVRRGSLLCWYIGASLAGLSPILSPSAAVAYWPRWCYMAVYPLAFMAIDGLDLFKGLRVTLNAGRSISVDIRRVMYGLLFAMILLLTAGFIFATPGDSPYQRMFGEQSGWLGHFVPTTMTMSTVTPRDAEAAVEVIEILNRLTMGKTVLLVDEEFRGYASLFLDLERVLMLDLGGTWYTDPSLNLRAQLKAEDLSSQGYEVYYISRPRAQSQATGFELVCARSSVSLYHYTK